jgi:hypothetical protein
MKKGDKEIPEVDKAPELTEDINMAFDDFFNLSSDATMFERFDALSHAIVAYRFHLLNRHRVTGKKRIDAEDVFLFDCNEQLKHIEKIIVSAKKLGRMSPASINHNYEGDLLAKIIRMKNSVGDIVTNVPLIKKEVAGE